MYKMVILLFYVYKSIALGPIAPPEARPSGATVLLAVLEPNLRKGNIRVPVRFARNSTVTDLRIYRAKEQVENLTATLRKLTLGSAIASDLEKMKYHEGERRPARIDWDRATTYDPGDDKVQAFKYRTTLLTTYVGQQVSWKDMEIFECAGEWSGRGKIALPDEFGVVVTIMERKPRDPTDYGKHEPPGTKRDVPMEQAKPADDIPSFGELFGEETPEPRQVEEPPDEGPLGSEVSNAMASSKSCIIMALRDMYHIYGFGAKDRECCVSGSGWQIVASWRHLGKV